MMDIEAKLEELGIILPDAPQPLGAYVPVKISNGFAFCSGALPLKDGALPYRGKLGGDVSTEEGKKAAALCAINVLANLKAALGDLNRIKGVVRVEGYINCAPGFTQQPHVLNGASEFFSEVFGDAGKHSRMVVGVSELPLDAPLELVCIFEIAL
jgi:enamine deaminase RidA (YjgF/YER057c/UK114 family)